MASNLRQRRNRRSDEATWKQYTSAIAKGLGAAGGGIAGAALGPVGMAVGSSLGSVLGGNIAKISGMGDYTVQSNSLTTQGMKIQPGAQVPEFGGANYTRIKHREYVGDILATGSSSFSSTSYFVNPANSQLFPWLSGAARLYSQYEFKGLVAQFVSMTSDITAGGGLGTVVLSSNYDPLQPAYTNKQEMENSQFTVSARPSHSMVHTFECDPRQRPLRLLYIDPQTGNESGEHNMRFYHMAKFQVALAGIPTAITAGTTLGELWLSYDVVLWKPVINTNPDTGGAYFFATAAERLITPTSIFGTPGNMPTNSGSFNVSVLGNVVSFPSAINSGLYKFTYSARGNARTVISQEVSFVLANCTEYRSMRNPRSLATYLSDQLQFDILVQVNDINAKITVIIPHTDLVVGACTELLYSLLPLDTAELP